MEFTRSLLAVLACVFMATTCFGQQQGTSLRSAWSNFMRNEAMGIDTPDYIKDRLRIHAIDMLGLGNIIGGSRSSSTSTNTFGGVQTVDQNIVSLGNSRPASSSSIIIQSSSNRNAGRQPTSLNSRLRRRRLIDLLFDKL